MTVLLAQKFSRRARDNGALFSCSGRPMQKHLTNGKAPDACLSEARLLRAGLA
jgi:hypothetical protein